MIAGTPTAKLTANVVIDASVWVSRLLPQDANHLIANTWVNNHIMAGGLFTPPTLLAIEVSASVFRRTKSTSDAQSALRQLYALPVMRLAQMDQTLVAEAIDITSTLGLRGADALYVALAKQLAIPLVSFDNEQLTLSQGIIQTIRP